KTGARNIILNEIDAETGEEVHPGILNDLGLVSETESKITQNNGKNSIFTINGVEIERSSNSISDAIEGTTINLHKAHTGDEYDTVNISLDTSKLTKAVQDFVDQYNSTMTFIEDKMAAGDPEVEGSRGTLAGDSSLMRLHSSLRNMVTSSISNEK